VRFLRTSVAKVFTGAGASGIDVYGTLIFGRHWYGVAKWDDMNQGGVQKMTQGLNDGGQSNVPAIGQYDQMVQMFIKALGSSGSADPLNQRGTIGWKVSHVCKILNQLCGVRVEHAV
jgi:N4-gp56 family major capsid protein